VTIYRVCNMLELMKSLQAFVRATDNAEKMDIPNQLPQKRKKRSSRQKMKELILHPSKRLAMNVYKCMMSVSA